MTDGVALVEGSALQTPSFNEKRRIGLLSFAHQCSGLPIGATFEAKSLASSTPVVNIISWDAFLIDTLDRPSIFEAQSVSPFLLLIFSFNVLNFLFWISPLACPIL